MSLRITLILLIAAASPAAADQQSEDARKTARLLADFRRAKKDAKRRAEITLKLAAISDDAVGKLRASIEKELAELTRSIEKRLAVTEKEKKLRDDIAQLRKPINALRNDRALTKQKIEQEGKPALDRLNVLYPGLLRLEQNRRRAVDLLLKQVAIVRESSTAVRDAWKDRKETPLPVADFIKQADELTRKGALSAEAKKTQAVLDKNAALARKIPVSVRIGIVTYNRLRMTCGLSPLEIDPKLCEAAYGHSVDMQKHKFFAHVSPVAGKKTFGDRARKAGTTASGENIYAGSPSGKKAIEGWFYSPGHHRIMMGNFRRVGLGNSRLHWTMLVGR